MKKALKIAGIVLLSAVALLLIFCLITSVVHGVKTKNEIKLLKDAGYYNPVSVGDYCLNVAKFGNPDGKHRIVGLAGLGMGDFALAARQMTASLEADNLVVFVDRAGYGFSDDTHEDMTLSHIVEDYRKALKEAEVEAPYLLMAHSIGGAYANYWVSQYPDEIEGVVFVDGSQLSEDAFVDEEPYEVCFGDRVLVFLAKLGFSRYVLREYHYHYPDNYTEEEQALGDALIFMTLDSVAPLSEDANLAENAQDAFSYIVTNGVPKLYICASWGIASEEDIIEVNGWINRQIEINKLDIPMRPLSYDRESVESILANYEKARREVIYPYAEKMGNCQVVLLAGDHMIYEQKPEACGSLIKEFIDGLEG